MTGNCLKGSRPIVVFDKQFDETPHMKVIKEVLMNVSLRLRQVNMFEPDLTLCFASAFACSIRSSPSPRLPGAQSPSSTTFSTSPSPTARFGSATTRFVLLSLLSPSAELTVRRTFTRSSTSLPPIPRLLPPPLPAPRARPPSRMDPRCRSTKLDLVSFFSRSRSLRVPSTAQHYTRTRVGLAFLSPSPPRLLPSFKN